MPAGQSERGKGSSNLGEDDEMKPVSGDLPMLSLPGMSCLKETQTNPVVYETL